jgi:hypothetical protein
LNEVLVTPRQRGANAFPRYFSLSH